MGFSGYTIGDEVAYPSSADHPDPTLRVEHWLIPIAHMGISFEDEKWLKTKSVLSRIKELAETLKSTEQLRPVRVIADPKGKLPFFVISGLITVRAMKSLGRTHVRCEVVPWDSQHVGRGIGNLETVTRERHLNHLYDDGPKGNQ
ncbi:MAG: hypothetical protein ACKVT0_23150 [Planctomycetaceae bacterium]